MKYLITQSKLKQFLKSKFEIDFSGQIELVDSAYKLLNNFDGCFSYVYLNMNLNSFGPMYMIKINNTFWVLYQERHGIPWIVDNDCDYYSKTQFMALLGIDSLGLSMDTFVDLYS